jgi:hypothetical protein
MDESVGHNLNSSEAFVADLLGCLNKEPKQKAAIQTVAA